MSSACSFSAADVDSSRPVVTGTDVVEYGRLYGFDASQRLLAYGEASLECYKRYVSLQSAACRSASSASSSGRGSPVGSGAGLTGTRLDSIRRVDSWRGSGELRGLGSVPRRGVVPNGLCHLKLLRDGVDESVGLRIGEWATFGSLVRQSSRIFKDLPALERFRLVDSGDQVKHVRAGGTEGVSFLDAVAFYASKIRAQPGTLAREVLDSGRPLVAVSGVTGRTRVGGVLRSVPSGEARSVLVAAARFGDLVMDGDYFGLGDPVFYGFSVDSSGLAYAVPRGTSSGFLFAPPCVEVVVDGVSNSERAYRRIDFVAGQLVRMKSLGDSVDVCFYRGSADAFMAEVNA